MLIYVSLIVLYSIIGFPQKSTKTKFVSKFLFNLLISFPLWVLIGFRSNEVGNDTEMYQYLFEQFKDESLLLSIVISHTEIGFIILCKFLGSIGVNFHGFILILATINIICFSYFFAKYSKNFGFSWMLFITLLFLPRCMNICREMLAVSIFLFSFDLILHKKNIQFIIFCLLLTLIHKSAFIILLVLVLLKIKNHNLRTFVVLIMCTGLLFTFQPIMDIFISRMGGKYDYLVDSKYTDTEGGIAKYLTLLFSFIAYFSFRVIEKKENHIKNIEIKYQLNVWKCFVLMSIVLSVAGINFGLADRAALYFTTSYLIILPNSLNYGSKNIAILRYLSMNIIFSTYFIIVLIYRNNWHTIVPYSFW